MWLYKILICTVSFCLPFSYAISLIPTCSDYYGSPDRRDCTNLLSPYSTDTAQRFLSVPLVSVRPEGVAIIAWALRKTLPWVRDQHNCNIALISVLQINGKYSEAVASYADILQHEFAGRRKSMPGGIIWDCLATSRVGGWRRVLEMNNVVMVLYESGSPYEKFLLSGHGASHYDAARAWLDGSLEITWTGGASAVASNLTHLSLQQGGLNVTDPPSGQHASS